MPKDHTTKCVDVEVLHTEGCPGTPPTIELINTVAAEMGIEIRLRETLITEESQKQAAEFRFLGSPTVRVNGLDIDPAAREATSYGFT